MKKITIIWNLYINKGYLLFFSNDGHIEVGFPDNMYNLNVRTRHSDDIRYPNNSIYDADITTKLTVGAGTTVGYKLASEWATRKDRNVDIFIYLDYLNNEY